MSSAEAFPPLELPTAVDQKPVRVVKLRPPGRPRPYIPPKPTAAKAPSSGRGQSQASETVKRILESLTEGEGLEERGSVRAAKPSLPIRAQPYNPTGFGNVRKIASRFHQASLDQQGKGSSGFAAANKMPPTQPPTHAGRQPGDAVAAVATEPALVLLPVPKPRSKPARSEGESAENGSCNQAELEAEIPRRRVDCGMENRPESTKEDLGSKHIHHSDTEKPDASVRTQCQRNCPCVCHLKRPGMVLAWVPASREEPDKGGGHEEVASSDSSSSGDATESKRFRHVFIVNRESHHGTGTDSAERLEMNGDVEASNSRRVELEDEPDRNDDSELKTSQSDPFNETRSKRNSYTTSSSSEESNGAGSDESTSVGKCEKNIVLVSYRSLEEDPSNDHGVLQPPSDQESLNSHGSGEEEASPIAPHTLRISKPPRRNKVLSQSSLESEESLPLVLPRMPAKPPRLSVRKSVAETQRDKVVPGEEEDTLETASQSPRNKLSPGPAMERLQPSSPKGKRSNPPSPNTRRSNPPSPKASQHLQDASHSTKGGCHDVQDDQETDGSHQELRRHGETLRRSVDWESRLQDEPLYQTYRQTVISKEIKRQTISRNISKTSYDYVYDWSPQYPERAGTSPAQGRRSAAHQSTLWQDLPVVRESGILEQISAEERKLQESMFEVLTSEASYQRSLNVLMEHFMNSKELEETMIIREKKILFSNITKVKEVSERFLKDLKERMDEGLLISDVCDLIHFYGQHHFQAYVDYVRNQVYQEKTYSFLMEKNIQFATVISRLQELPQCQRLPFMSFLLLPFQRITRIKMLTENILKRTEVGSTREQNASKALASISKIIEECNREVGKMKQMEELIHIGKKLEFDKLKAIPIISQVRHLEKQGELSEIVHRGTLFSLKPKFTPLYLFLFNDLLLITIRKSSDRYVVADHAHRSLVQVQSYAQCAQGSAMENCFYLTLLENHQGKTSERLLKAPTQLSPGAVRGALHGKAGGRAEPGAHRHHQHHQENLRGLV
ncbi:rho guanine nucleotide exchange factor 15 isoform X2 [Latimeria chalumnae]|uniref:rho guanine nucleotide exchange factor 15 isoform X2 n=1 Tax=Latimeria chalumnae TaxID=7897 RepID=UPI0003C189ED